MKFFAVCVRWHHVRTCICLFLITLTGGWSLRAQDQIISGSLDVYGNTFNLGTWANDATKLGLGMTYEEDANHAATLTLLGNRPVAHWLWQRNLGAGTGFVRQMLLSSDNVLTLYDTATPQATAIVLDPTGTSTFQSNTTFNGANNEMPNQTYVNSATVLTVGLADARYSVHSSGNNLSLGVSANAIGDKVVAMGVGATANGVNDVALGYNSSATFSASTALGSGSIARNTCTTSVGYASTANGPYATALGVGTLASAQNSIALGTGSQATQPNAMALGTNAQATAENSLAVGEEARATGFASTAIGQYTLASDVYTTAVGHFTYASGYEASAYGIGSMATGYQSTALGFQTGVSGAAATAVGLNSSASGAGAVALGSFSNASGAYATALTSSSVASGDYSTAGGNTTASGYYQFAIGKNSVPSGDAHAWVTTDDLFTVGNGQTPAAPSNAFAVKKNGDTTVGGNLTVVKALIVQPQGDLSMGDFTAQPSPSPTP